MKFVAQTLKRAAYAAIGVLVLATPAQGQTPPPPETFNFDNYCVMGSWQVCASVRLTSTGNNLTMQVWNLEGMLGQTHTMTAIGLYHSGSFFDWQAEVSSWNARHYLTNTTYNTITNYWSEGGASDIETLGEGGGVRLELAEGTRGNRGIAGCEALDGGTKWQTCNSFADAPFVQFSFTFRNNLHFSLENVELRWHSTQTGADQEGSLKCDTGGAGDYPDCIPPTVVPEPATMVLLGSGMAGLGAFARRRRRRKQDAS
jgi:hypothetical protein